MGKQKHDKGRQKRQDGAAGTSERPYGTHLGRVRVHVGPPDASNKFEGAPR